MAKKKPDKKYDKDVIIKKLERKGIKPKYIKNTRTISHFESNSPNVKPGIKLLGYLDFLKVPFLKKEIKQKLKRKREIQTIFPKGAAWSFTWFSNKKSAEDWYIKQKINEKNLDFNITQVNIHFNNGEFKACIEGIQK